MDACHRRSPHRYLRNRHNLRASTAVASSRAPAPLPHGECTLLGTSHHNEYETTRSPRRRGTSRPRGTARQEPTRPTPGPGEGSAFSLELSGPRELQNMFKRAESQSAEMCVGTTTTEQTTTSACETTVDTDWLIPISMSRLPLNYWCNISMFI